MILKEMCFAASLVFIGCNQVNSVQEKPIKECIIRYEETVLDDWQIFVMALAEVESENNPYAEGKTQDVGIFQITPIYIDEVNRLEGSKVYSLEDRYDPYKSVEMLNIINEHKNCNRDIEKAIKIHNPGAGKTYRNKIIKKMDEIKKRETVRYNVLRVINQ